MPRTFKQVLANITDYEAGLPSYKLLNDETTEWVARINTGIVNDKDYQDFCVNRAAD